jgi:hypothetical protein
MQKKASLGRGMVHTIDWTRLKERWPENKKKNKQLLYFYRLAIIITTTYDVTIHADGPVCLLTPPMSPFLYCLGALRALVIVIVIVTASGRDCHVRRPAHEKGSQGQTCVAVETSMCVSVSLTVVSMFERELWLIPGSLACIVFLLSNIFL